MSRSLGEALPLQVTRMHYIYNFSKIKIKTRFFPNFMACYQEKPDFRVKPDFSMALSGFSRKVGFFRVHENWCLELPDFPSAKVGFFRSWAACIGRYLFLIPEMTNPSYNVIH